MYDAETETMPRCRSVETETLEWHYQDETDVQKRLRDRLETETFETETTTLRCSTTIPFIFHTCSK